MCVCVRPSGDLDDLYPAACSRCARLGGECIPHEPGKRKKSKTAKGDAPIEDWLPTLTPTDPTQVAPTADARAPPPGPLPMPFMQDVPHCMPVSASGLANVPTFDVAQAADTEGSKDGPEVDVSDSARAGVAMDEAANDEALGAPSELTSVPLEALLDAAGEAEGNIK